MVYIYALLDNRINEIKYIGKTTDIKRRYRRHINERFMYDSYKDRWLRKIINENYYPEIIVLDEVSENEWEFWEIFYIGYFKLLGSELTNSTKGGIDMPSTKGIKFSDERRKKMSDAYKGKKIPWLNNGPRTDEHRRNLSLALKGRVSVNKGNKYSDEFKKKLSEASTCKRKVKQLTRDGELIKVWDSISEAQKTLKIRHISEVCLKHRHHKTSGGYKWEHE